MFLEKNVYNAMVFMSLTYPILLASLAFILYRLKYLYNWKCKLTYKLSYLNAELKREVARNERLHSYKK